MTSKKNKARSPQTTKAVFKVHAVRSGKWWALEVPEVKGALSQVRRLDEAEAMITEAITLVLDVPADSFGVEIVPIIDRGPVDESVQIARDLRSDVAFLREMADDMSRLSARAQVEVGVPVRDIAATLGVSFQYAARLASEAVGTEIDRVTALLADRIDTSAIAKQFAAANETALAQFREAARKINAVGLGSVGSEIGRKLMEVHGPSAARVKKSVSRGTIVKPGSAGKSTKV